MANVKTVQIYNKQEVYDFCNKLMGCYMDGKEMAPITISYGFGEKRTTQQNKWYWKWLSDYVVKFFQDNPTELVRLILNKVLKFHITPELIHEMLKVVYNNGISTTKNDTKTMIAYSNKIREDFMFEFNLAIPEPEVK